jgi:cold shock CspA family protein
MQGVVKFFNATSNYGFLQPDAPGSPDVFFHGSTLKGVEISRGDILVFDVAEGPDGRPRAKNIRVLA